MASTLRLTVVKLWNPFFVTRMLQNPKQHRNEISDHPFVSETCSADRESTLNSLVFNSNAADRHILSQDFVVQVWRILPGLQEERIEVDTRLDCDNVTFL